MIRYLLSVTGSVSGAAMVGDTHYDVTGAHKRGLPCIGVTWGYGLREEIEAAGADAIVDSPLALKTYLLEEPV